MAYVDTAAIFSETAQLAVALAIGLEIRQTRTNQDLGQVLCQWSVFAHQVGVSSSLGRRLQAQIRPRKRRHIRGRTGRVFFQLLAIRARTRYHLLQLLAIRARAMAK